MLPMDETIKCLRQLHERLATTSLIQLNLFKLTDYLHGQTDGSTTRVGRCLWVCSIDGTVHSMGLSRVLQDQLRNLTTGFDRTNFNPQIEWDIPLVEDPPRDITTTCSVAIPPHYPVSMWRSYPAANFLKLGGPLFGPLWIYILKDYQRELQKGKAFPYATMAWAGGF